MSIDWGSVLGKVNSYMKSEECNKKVKSYISDCASKGVKSTPSGAPVLTKETIEEVSNLFLKMYYESANQFIPDMSITGSGKGAFSVAQNMKEMTMLEIEFNPDSSRQVVTLGFPDDSILHRNSLYYRDRFNNQIRRTGGGIDNILALFNNGYSTGEITQVSGYWERHEHEHKGKIRSRKYFYGYNFMSEVIEEFNSTYGAMYNCKAICINDDYILDDYGGGVYDEDYTF